MQRLIGQIRFGDCVIDPLARTVARGGRFQSFQPKVIDLVLYLIAHRDRVVSKGELLEQVWGRRVVVTGGVVARTVMKARRLIGDDADEAAIIKTIHSVGYRFIAPIDPDLIGAPDENRPVGENAGAADAQGGLNVAILPFRNDTGKVEFSWVDLGLMTATIESLEGNASLRVLPARDVLATVGDDVDAIEFDKAVDGLRRSLHATDIIQARLAQGDDQSFALHYRCTGPHLSDLAGTLTGPDPFELCRSLASAVAGAAAGQPHTSGDDADGEDPFLRTARLRARQAVDAERWETARRLLRVILDLKPDDLAMRLEYGRCLAWLRDPQAEPMLSDLRDRAHQGRHRKLEIDALHCLAIFQHSCGHSSTAEQLLNTGLKLAEHEDTESELGLLMTLSVILADKSSSAAARWTLDRVATLAQSLGNQVAAARVLDLRGRLAMLRGDAPAAHGDFQQAVALCEEFGLQSSTSFSWTHLGYTTVSQGRMKDAAMCFDKAFDFALHSGDPVAIGISAAARMFAGSLWPGDQDCGADTMARLHLADRVGNPVIEAHGQALEAVLAARSGELTLSIKLLDKAEGSYSRPSFLARVSRLRIRVLVCLAMLDEASELCDQLQAHATGRTQGQLSSIVLHLRALIAHADGNDAAAVEHLIASMAQRPATLARGDAAFDAAWLHLEAGDAVRAEQVLAQLGGFLDQALHSNYGPALLVKARLHFAQGQRAMAVSMQRRYCEQMRCPAQSGAARCLSAYERGAGLENISRIRALPSMFDLVPHLGSLRMPMH